MDEGANPTELRAQGRVGQVLRGKWRLDRLIGVGGMAAVYAATHRNGKRGAVKMLHLELSGHEGLRNRFLREGYAANTVDHPGAVSVLDDDVTEDGSVFLVMELLTGKSLDAVVAERPSRTLTIPEVLAVADDLLDVLGAAHGKGIVHRDLKPENLFVTKRGELKVLDFGIARLLDAQGSASATKTGTALGTPAFMPPEQALGNVDQIDARTDLWAAGATLFALLTGRPVHSAPTLSQVLLAAMTQPAPSLAEVMPGAPRGLVEVIDRALQPVREERWQNAAAFQSAIRALRNEFQGELPPPPPSMASGTAGTIATPVPMGTGDRHPSGGTEFTPPTFTPATGTGPGMPMGTGPGMPMGPGSPVQGQTSPGAALGATPSYMSAPAPGTTSGVAVAEPGRPKGRGLLLVLLGAAVAVAAGLGVMVATKSPAAETSGAAADTGSATAAAATDATATATAGPSAPPTVEPSAAPTAEPAAAASADAGAAPSATPTVAAVPKATTGPKPTAAPTAKATAKPKDATAVW